MVYIKSNAEQTILLPTDLRTIISQDHICYLIEVFTDVINVKIADSNKNVLEKVKPTNIKRYVSTLYEKDKIAF